jgi:acetyl/propionyl-CoA carboxylase alpha subunit
MVHEKERYLVTVDEAEFDFNIARAGGVFELENGGRNYRVVVDHVSNHKYLFKINDSVLEIDITKNNGELEIFLDGRQMAVRVEPYSLAELRKKAGMSAGNAEERHIRAPMPGLVLKANVKAGDDVK